MSPQSIIEAAIEVLGTNRFTLDGDGRIRIGSIGADPLFVSAPTLATIMDRADEIETDRLAKEARLAQFPNLEPDRFWAAVKFFGFEADLLTWVAAIKPTDPESPTYVLDLAFWSEAAAKLERAKYFERDHPMIEGARQALGITEQQLDNMWMWALS
ncbi:hypothetical protein JP74_21805 [Devosia sp. 17-2-E-8]|nr:hypothetical protein JP74_21805 [Devosia sp. 17-2-E-8]